jgi:hypothetical protein
VLSAPAVSRIGPETLDMMNRGANLPAITQPAPYTAAGLHRYGAGGRIDSGAGHAGPTDLSTHLHIDAIHAWDGQSVKDMAEEYGDVLGKAALPTIKRHFRTGGVF